MAQSELWVQGIEPLAQRFAEPQKLWQFVRFWQSNEGATAADNRRRWLNENNAGVYRHAFGDGRVVQKYAFFQVFPICSKNVVGAGTLEALQAKLKVLVSERGAYKRSNVTWPRGGNAPRNPPGDMTINPAEKAVTAKIFLKYKPDKRPGQDYDVALVILDMPDARNFPIESPNWRFDEQHIFDRTITVKNGTVELAKATVHVDIGVKRDGTLMNGDPPVAFVNASATQPTTQPG